MNETFFVVWNPAHGLPKERHSTYEIAVREAKRLAAIAPGAEFFVLQANCKVVREEPVTITHLDEIPF